MITLIIFAITIPSLAIFCIMQTLDDKDLYQVSDPHDQPVNFVGGQIPELSLPNVEIKGPFPWWNFELSPEMEQEAKKYKKEKSKKSRKKATKKKTSKKKPVKKTKKRK